MLFCHATLLVLISFSTRANALQFTDLINEDAPETEEGFLTPEDFDDVKNFKEDEPTLKKILKEKDIDVDTDPILRAHKYEGDVAAHNAKEIKEFVKNSNYMGRNAIKSRWQLWPGGEIPYVLSSRYGPYSKRVIAKAIDEYHRKSCVKFVPRDGERDYVYIFPDEGCYSLVGRVGGRQPLSLDAGCIQTGTIVHEFMHATGFFHEQSRADRDDWIDIQWDNVIPEAKDQFESYSLRTIQHLGVEYDYSSIMHYGPYAFSQRPYSSSGKTIKALKSGSSKMGQREGFSKRDLEKINKLYQCRDSDIEEPGAGIEGGSGGGTSEGTSGGGTDGTSTSDCQDYRWDCFLRRALGYCHSHESTRDNCRKTCNLCDEGTSASGGSESSGTNTGGSSTTEVESSGTCEDRKSKCSDWSESGYCRKYKKYMERNCPSSCGFCGKKSASSKESSGEVSENSIRANVKEKIKVTLPEDSDADSTCTDGNQSHCDKWSKKGFCTKYPSYMGRKCKKSCSLC